MRTNFNNFVFIVKWCCHCCCCFSTKRLANIQKWTRAYLRSQTCLFFFLICFICMRAFCVFISMRKEKRVNVFFFSRARHFHGFSQHHYRCRCDCRKDLCARICDCDLPTLTIFTSSSAMSECMLTQSDMALTTTSEIVDETCTLPRSTEIFKLISL